MCPTLSATVIMNNTHSFKDKAHATQEIIGGKYDQGSIDNVIHKPKYHWSYVSCSIKIKVKGDNFVTMYNMAL